MQNNIVKCIVPENEVKRIKGLGFLRDKTTEDKFNCRVITVNGRITSDQMRIIADAADKFGSGKVAFTTRLTCEVQGIPYDNIQSFIDFIEEHNMSTGGTGPRTRPIVSCKGTTCQYGLIDTYALSEKIHQLYYVEKHSDTLPHKFKIAVGGCPNNCVKPNLNDIGIIGQRIPEPCFDKCKGCKKCMIELACPIKAAKVVDGKITIDTDRCNHCGRCFAKCPFKCFEEPIDGYKLYIGGRWGKLTANAHSVSKIFKTEDEVLLALEKAYNLFKNEGIAGERFSDTIERLGFDYVETKILENI